MTMDLSDDEWRQKLTPEQYHVLREKGTERPGTGELLYNEKEGDYTCAACGTVLFTSDSKYESNLPGLEGWPSFAEAVHDGKLGDMVKLVPDHSHGMVRTEVICKHCSGHLGHLFEDASSPTNQHYCINSAALAFKPRDVK